MESLYLIWSIEHQAWWLPNHNGYTDEPFKAGQYNIIEARQILAQANLVMTNEAMIPIECVL